MEACGELDARAGSSPLTRGKLTHGNAGTQQIRLIPAHAGKTMSRDRFRMLSSAHPRSRGENRLALLGGGGVRGSSPLTRGKLALDRGLTAPKGLIPAHAGKTLNLVMIDEAWAAHPRSRGENAFSVSRPLSSRGSSPLTRGKLPRQLIQIIT